MVGVRHATAGAAELAARREEACLVRARIGGRRGSPSEPLPPARRRRRRLTAGLVWACLLLPLAGLFADAARAQTTIWSATLTPGQSSGNNGGIPTGYCRVTCGNSNLAPFGALSDHDFEYGGRTYNIDRLTGGTGRVSTRSCSLGSARPCR